MMLNTLTAIVTLASGAGDVAVEPDLLAAANPFAPQMLVVVRVGFVLLVIGIVLCLYRILRGPHQADKVLAADVLAMHVVGLVILLTIRLAKPYFFDAVLVVAIVGFASSVAFAQYIGARAAGEDLE